jgi:hypothetical protein
LDGQQRFLSDIGRGLTKLRRDKQAGLRYSVPMPRTERQPWRKWNAALWWLQDDLLNLASETPLTQEQRQLLATVVDKCKELLVDPQWIGEPTNRELALKYAVAPRTIQNWRAAGCPFDAGQWRVLDWMARRRYLPERCEARFAKELNRRRLRHFCRDMRALGKAWKQTQRQLRQAGLSLPALLGVAPAA